MDRHYTYKFCSPSRSSLMTGRLPFHVNVYNDPPTMVGQGVPTNMTMLSLKLKESGSASQNGVRTPYATHFIGKWHMGMASKSKQTPQARGFDTSLAYFHSENNYYNQRRAEGCGGHAAVDLYVPYARALCKN